MCKKRGISEQTYYWWRKEYGGLRLDQAKRLKELEREDTRLKKLVADQAFDNSILKEVALVRHRLGVSERRACRVLGQAVMFRSVCKSA